MASYFCRSPSRMKSKCWLACLLIWDSEIKYISSSFRLMADFFSTVTKELQSCFLAAFGLRIVLEIPHRLAYGRLYIQTTSNKLSCFHSSNSSNSIFYLVCFLFFLIDFSVVLFCVKGLCALASSTIKDNLPVLRLAYEWP